MSKEATSQSAPVLHAKGLSKAFQTPRGDIPVLRNVDLQIRAGESVSIRGESGCGKTTLLYLLSALEQADSGEIIWDGLTLSGRSTAWITRKRASLIGFVFQAYYLVPELDALANVLLVKRLLGRISRDDRKRAEDLLQRVGLGERIHHTSTKLSGGERQRVAVARALMNRPRLILADEPTGNLDERTGEDVMNLLMDLSRQEDVALALVTHNREFAQRTDCELLLAGGSFQDARNKNSEDQ